MKLRNQILTLGAMALCGSSAFALTHVTGNITTSTYWTVAPGPGNNGSPYILETQLFVTGAGTILTIEEGVIIRGQPQSSTGAADAGSLIVRPEAKVQMNGTIANPIIFTTAAIDSGLGAAIPTAATGIALDANANGKADRWVEANNGDTEWLDLNPSTSPLPVLNPLGAKNTSMWGGIIIAGDSLTNSGKEVDVNGDTFLTAADDGFGYIEGVTAGPLAVYGGGNTEHNGGIMKYVSIRHGGAELSTTKEINGLTLYAVGSKTTISNIDVYAAGDDGVEIFGGTVNLDHLNLTYCDDDGFDVDEGWQGLAQFIFILQGRGYGDNGMELDGEDKLELDKSTFGSPTAANPIGDARIYNVTALVSTEAGVSASGTSVNAARMRAGFAGQIVNSIFQNYSTTPAGQGLRVDGLKTTGFGTNAETAEYGNSARTYYNLGQLQLRNNTVSGFTTQYTAITGTIAQSAAGGASGTFNGSAIPNVYYPAAGNRNASTSIPVPTHVAPDGVDPRPSIGANSLDYANTQNPAYVPFHAQATAYRGAFDRDAATLWTTGWTALNEAGILKN